MLDRYIRAQLTEQSPHYCMRRSIICKVAAGLLRGTGNDIKWPSKSLLCEQIKNAV